MTISSPGVQNIERWRAKDIEGIFINDVPSLTSDTGVGMPTTNLFHLAADVRSFKKEGIVLRSVEGEPIVKFTAAENLPAKSSDSKHKALPMGLILEGEGRANCKCYYKKVGSK
jgi:hypothetical protein